MNILGFKPKNLIILSHSEIKKRGKEAYLNAVKKAEGKKYILDSLEDSFKRLNKEPLPFALFRLNELLDYSLNFVGCEITEKAYFERLGVLPPINFKYGIFEGFFVHECITENIYEHNFEHDKKNYCVLMSLQKNELRKE